MLRAHSMMIWNVLSPCAVPAGAVAAAVAVAVAVAVKAAVASDLTQSTVVVLCTLRL